MNQLKLSFSVSKNPTDKEIRSCDFIGRLERFNRSQRQEKKEELDLQGFCLKFKIDYEEEINKPFDQLSIYKRFSRRTYNK